MSGAVLFRLDAVSTLVRLDIGNVDLLGLHCLSMLEVFGRAGSIEFERAIFYVRSRSEKYGTGR